MVKGCSVQRLEQQMLIMNQGTVDLSRSERNRLTSSLPFVTLVFIKAPHLLPSLCSAILPVVGPPLNMKKAPDASKIGIDIACSGMNKCLQSLHPCSATNAKVVSLTISIIFTVSQRGNKLLRHFSLLLQRATEASNRKGALSMVWLAYGRVLDVCSVTRVPWRIRKVPCLGYLPPSLMLTSFSSILLFRINCWPVSIIAGDSTERPRTHVLVDGTKKEDGRRHCNDELQG